MDDVLQPRSRHSWDVLKAWFIAAGGREVTTTTTAATTAATSTGTATATTVVATAPAEITTKKCDKEEDDDEEMTPVLPRDVKDDGGDGCGHGDDANGERTPREARRETESTAAAAEPPNAPEKDGDGTVAAAASSASAEERTGETESAASAAAAAELPNALEKDGVVVTARPAAASPVDAEGPARPPPTWTTSATTSKAEEGMRETASTADAASESPNALERDGAVVAGPPAAPADAAAAAASPSPTTTAVASGSVAGEGGNSDVASPTRPLPAADSLLEAACRAQPSGGGCGGDSGRGDDGDVDGACGDWIVSECKVADDGTCGSCGEVLRSIELSEDDEERLLKQVGTSVVMMRFFLLAAFDVFLFCFFACVRARGWLCVYA